MENGWETFGVPAIITSDKGPQFVRQWWRTMFARLGIRRAYQTHANGLVEVTGINLIGFLWRMWTEEGVNWSDAYRTFSGCTRIHQ